jgi:hypothetical protein
MWKNTVAIHSILKEKKLQSKIFNQLNVKKLKLIKIILEKKNKQEKGKKGGKSAKKKEREKSIVDYCCNPQ